MADETVAESLERQNNLNFANVRIDGEATDHPLSALTSEQIASAEATKVPTPDLDADAIGGLLEITSRRAFEQKKPTLRGSMAASLDPLVGEWIPDATFTFGRSLGSHHAAGFLATIEMRGERDRDEEIRLEWDPRFSDPTEFAVADENGIGGALNFHGSFDWKWRENRVGFIRAEVQQLTERIQTRQLRWRLPPLAVAIASGAFTRADFIRTVDEQQVRHLGWTIAGGVTQRSGTLAADLHLLHRATSDRLLEGQIFEFTAPDQPVRYVHAERRFPTIEALTAMSDDTLSEIRRHRARESSRESVVRFDLGRQPDASRTSLRWKAGTKARLQQTTHTPNFESFVPIGTFRSREFPRGTSRTILENRYDLAGFPDARELRRAIAPSNLRLLAEQTRSDTDPSTFDVRRNIFAGYLMASGLIHGTRLLAGVRVEHTVARFDGNEVTIDEDGRYAGTREIAARRQDAHVFPGLHASRALTKNLRLFASWTLSIRRPDYVEQVPARRVDRSEREIEEGNALLRPALYTNYDLAFDYSYRDGGGLSLELYHREIRDPTLVRRTVLTESEFVGFERTRPQNGGTAQLQGTQLSWRQPLAPLSSALTDLSFELDATFEHSRQEIDNRPGDSLPLVERPEVQVSAQLTYERRALRVSLEVEHAGRALDSVGTTAQEDRFRPSLQIWNLSLSYKLQEGLRLFADLENLSATADQTYLGDPSRPDEYALDLREYRLGVRWEL